MPTVATATPTTLRSIYRRFLRELPTRSPSILANPSPIQHHLRKTFFREADSDSDSARSNSASSSTQLEAADQYVQYLAAQRMYTTLIERYNPGMNMDEEERVRLSARRVGMNMPEEFVRGSVGASTTEGEGEGDGDEGGRGKD